MGVHEHHEASRRAQVRCAVVTVSDTRTRENDTGGDCARRLLTAAGYVVAESHLLRDEPADVANLVRRLAAAKQVDAVILTGGTGVSRRDGTYEALSGLLEKRLDGFGELFRMLSHADIGAAAMLSRAVGGVYQGLILFATPGSPAAVELAVSRLIAPELRHLVHEVNR